MGYNGYYRDRPGETFLKAAIVIIIIITGIGLLIMIPHWCRSEGIVMGKEHVAAWTEHIPGHFDDDGDWESAKNVRHPDQYYLYVGESRSRMSVNYNVYLDARINKDLLVNGFYGSKIIRPEDLKPE